MLSLEITAFTGLQAQLIWMHLVTSMVLCATKESKKDGKDQESIQSSATYDQGYHMGKRQKHN